MPSRQFPDRVRDRSASWNVDLQFCLAALDCITSAFSQTIIQAKTRIA